MSPSPSPDDGGALVPLSDEAALAHAGTLADSHAILRDHARSFRWASVLLPADARDDAAVLYAFCRIADDAVDEASSIEAGEAALRALREELDGVRRARPIVAAFRAVMRKRNLSRVAVDELLEGIATDAGRVFVEGDEGLLRYCYRVAGCVGLLMCGVIGVDDKRALPHAIDLGIGMQLTNICRDVLEDARMGRLYVPADRIEAAGGDAEGLLRVSDETPPGLVPVVRELLHLAERYYRSGTEGFAYIPLRTRFAISAASTIYRRIGRKLLAHGANPWRGRTRVGPWGKLAGLLSSLPRALFPPTAATHDEALHRWLRGLPGARGSAEVGEADAPSTAVRA